MTQEHVDLVEGLHSDSVVIDGLTFLYDGPSNRLNPSRVTAINLTAAETDRTFDEAVHEIMQVRAIAASDPNVTIVQTADDIINAKTASKIGIILGFQASLPVETDLTRLHPLHLLGVRILQLTYNDRTYAGDGCLEPHDGGLSRFGRRLIREMNSCRMLLDLSHVGRRTSLEAIEFTQAPPIVSHSNPSALTDNPRNLNDKQIRALADAGGVVGCCCWAPLCWKNRSGQRPTVEDFADHIDYVVNLAGVDHVGLSTDSACTESKDLVLKHSLEFNAVFPEIAGPYRQNVSMDVEAEFPHSLPGVADLRPVTGALLRRGYRQEDIGKILGGNFLRVFREVWGVL